MSPRLRPEVEAVFAGAIEQPETELESFLARECGGNPMLRAEVETLLRNYRAAGDFLEPRAPCASEATKTGPVLPDRIGHYQIIRLVGEGGMGLVYEAEQFQPRRTVALKVIKTAFASPEMLRRFEQESQTLGRLQHPGIAQIYEAGMAESGSTLQPYFAMEFIRGESLLRHAESQQLNSRERLELMIKVCDAVQHAHQRGVIHRDLKPGNIMVDDTRQPKILDFGVARATDPEARAAGRTSLGELVGTLLYMSPEQALADPLEVDVRTDVYALGVILFELLAGRPPYALGRELHAAVLAIREADPARLGSIDRGYSGDIEIIVAKALEKDKARRYASAADLAADIHRFLNDEPIVARPPSVAYQAQKFARRHRALVTATAAIFAVLLAGIFVSMSEAGRARRAEQAALRERDRSVSAERVAATERNRAVGAEAQAVQDRNRAVTEKQRADTEAATAKAINDFLENDVLAQASARVQARPDTRPQPDLTVRTALDRAARGIAGKFDREPLVEASVRQTIGKTYRDLGLYLEAQDQMERALDLRRRFLGDQSPDTLTTMDELAEVYHGQGKRTQVEPLYRGILKARRHILGAEHTDTLGSAANLAVLLMDQGKYGEAEALMIQTLEIQRRVAGEADRNTLSMVMNLGQLYSKTARYAQAEPLYTKSLEIRRRVLGAEHPDTLIGMNNLAGCTNRKANIS
jgi:tetratricopeptide (TPR) repeat protein